MGITGLYLITGFLGAGKTTFLKKFIGQMSGKRMRILVNEFGKEGIDGKLLAELGVLVDEINNGSIFCSCRLDKFEAVLQEALEDKPELIIVEASGLSDPTNIRKILAQQDKFAEIDFLGSICVVDAINLKKIFSTARVCKKQISISDILIINKTDIASEAEIVQAEELLHSFYPNITAHRTSFGEINPQWLNEMQLAKQEASQPTFNTKEIGLQKALITVKSSMSQYELTSFLEMFIEDTYRIKGFAQLAGETYLVDCVGAMVSVLPYSGEVPQESINKIVVLAGVGMPMQKSLETAAQWYKAQIADITRGD